MGAGFQDVNLLLRFQISTQLGGAKRSSHTTLTGFLQYVLLGAPST
jgi:hypothetical protein